MFILNGFGVKKLGSALQTIFVYLEAPRFQPEGGLEVLEEILSIVISKPYFLQKPCFGKLRNPGYVQGDCTSSVAALAFGKQHAESDHGTQNFLHGDCHTHTGLKTHTHSSDILANVLAFLHH